MKLLQTKNCYLLSLNYLFITVSLIAFAPLISLAKDKSMIVPVFEFYQTDNLNGGTSSAQFNNNGTLVSTPHKMKPQSGTVYKAGVIWVNVYSTLWGNTKLSISPFLFIEEDSKSYAPSKTVGSTLKLTLLDTIEQKVTTSLSAGRVIPKLNVDRSNFLSVGFKFKQVIDQTQNVTLGITSSRVNAIANNTFDPTNNSISATYSKKLDVFKIKGGAMFTDRNSKTASFSGTDRKVFFETKYPVGPQDIYAKYSHTESSDNAKRNTQSAARKQTSKFFEIGYSMPIPVTDLAKLNFYASRLDANSNLTLFESQTNTFGIKVSLNF